MFRNSPLWMIVEYCLVRSRAAAQDDRGSTTIQEVLWYVAAGVSVAVIALIVYGAIKSQAETPPATPSAP